jgi:hypothetical protein
MTNFVGTYIPLPGTEAERQQTGDPRPSIESLYSSKEDYLALAKRAAGSLVKQGFLLGEDVDRVVQRAADHWVWIMKN